jgi:predicted transcriptional regulator
VLTDLHYHDMLEGTMRNLEDAMCQDVKDLILETIESSLEAQLRAVRRLRSPQVDRQQGKSKSQIEMVFDILAAAENPLHITEIITRVEQKFKVKLNRESIVSALTKKIVHHDRFQRTDKNTFGLIGD